MGFISSQGIVLAGNDSMIIDDKYRGHTSLENMRATGKISISEFSVNDPLLDSRFSNDPYNSVSSPEFNSFARGIYAVLDTWEVEESIEVHNTHYTMRNTLPGPFDLSSKNVLFFRFDSLESEDVTVELPKGIMDLATLVALLNRNTDFAELAVASSTTIDEVDYLLITTNSIGTNAKVELLTTDISSAHEIVGLEEPVVVAPTLTCAVVTFKTIGPTNQGIAGVEHKVQLRKKAASSEEGDGNSSEYFAQRVTSGDIELDQLFLSEFTVLSGDDGFVTFEVGTTSAAPTEDGCWLDISLPTNYFLAQKPSTRLQITGE